MSVTPPQTRSQRLKAATTDLHDRLDVRIMALDPFAAPDRYVRFLRVQQAFQDAIAPLYSDAALQALIPDLADRDRSSAIAADLRDVALPPPALPDADHGARHLAGHPDGRAAHWRRFTAAVDDAAMSDAEEARMIDAARDAFARFRALTEAAFA